jgi:hypothetical protein
MINKINANKEVLAFYILCTMFGLYLVNWL